MSMMMVPPAPHRAGRLLARGAWRHLGLRASVVCRGQRPALDAALDAVYAVPNTCRAHQSADSQTGAQLSVVVQRWRRFGPGPGRDANELDSSGGGRGYVLVVGHHRGPVESGGAVLATNAVEAHGNACRADSSVRKNFRVARAKPVDPLITTLITITVVATSLCSDARALDRMSENCSRVEPQGKAVT